jgi:hypothetical protein
VDPPRRSETERSRPVFSLEAKEDSEDVLDEPESGGADGAQSTDEAAVRDRADRLAEYRALAIESAVWRRQRHLGRN